MRQVEFAIGEYYHVYNRGVDKQIIFREDSDYDFFLKLLCVCNTTSTWRKPKKNPSPLTSVVSYTLLPNHFHLQLFERNEHGVSRFMHKIEIIYSHYFNIKYNRKGTLYESSFGVKPILSEAHFEHTPRYIHLNILDLTKHDWRSGFVQDWPDALQFMFNYAWSSHKTYLTKEQRYPILDMNLIQDLFSSPSEYIEFLRSWSQSDITLAEIFIADSLQPSCN